MNKLLAIALALPAVLAHATTPGAEFAVAHRLVDVDGRKLNLYCSGSGSPTVVFESPSGAPGWAWRRVQPEVAKRTRACVYDRAGYGFSDPSPHAADIAGAVVDLHALLAAAQVGPPYVLVGNSFGGAAMEAFAWKHPGEVAGLVLVEPMHEDENVKPDALTHGGLTDGERQILAFGAACEAQSLKGFDPKSEAYAQCIGGVDPALAGTLGDVDLAQRLAPAWWHARQAERHSFAPDREQLRAARRPFGTLPVIVLVRGVSPYLVPGKPPGETNKAIEAANLELMTAVAQSSSRGEVRVIAGAGHEVQETHPQAVVTAVADVLSKAGR